VAKVLKSNVEDSLFGFFRADGSELRQLAAIAKSCKCYRFALFLESLPGQPLWASGRASGKPAMFSAGGGFFVAAAAAATVHRPGRGCYDRAESRSNIRWPAGKNKTSRRKEGRPDNHHCRVEQQQ
jgi:hypothetical protein